MTTITDAARNWLDSTDMGYFNRMLKDLCNGYKTIRDFKGEKKGGNFNGIPHRIGESLTDRFGGSAWPVWYATVALSSPQTKGVGKRRLILGIYNRGDFGTVQEAVFTPTHYGDNPRQTVPDFVILTGLTLNLNVGFAYKGNPPTVALPPPPVVLPPPPTVSVPRPSINQPTQGPLVLPFFNDPDASPDMNNLINSVLAASGAFDD